MSIELVVPSSHLILCRPLLFLPSIFPSIRVFSNESALRIRWPKYWSFSFSISPSNEYSGLISFKMDWFDLLAVQETFKSLLQHHSSKASILWLSAFFIVQFSHPYMTTGKTIDLTIWTFVSKVTSLLFNMLSSFVILGGEHGDPLQYSCLENPCGQRTLAGYSPWGCRESDTTEQLSTVLSSFFFWGASVLISRLLSPSMVILEPKKVKSVTVSIVSPSICHEVMGQMPWS